MINVDAIMSGSLKSDIPPCPPSDPAFLNELPKPGVTLGATASISPLPMVKDAKPTTEVRPMFRVEPGHLIKGVTVDRLSFAVGEGGEEFSLDKIRGGGR